MIPNVFVSSTIQDLQHLRESIRDAILEIEFVPIMSEYGEVGYLPDVSAVESCYITMRQCQLAVIIIGKRYGEAKGKKLSVTHNEFLTAKNHNVPIITLVDKAVLEYRNVFEAKKNKKKDIEFPGMDNAAKTFELLNDIMSSQINNGIQAYVTVADAKKRVKMQIGHIFGEMLGRSEPGIVRDVSEVLAEIKSLRHELTKNSKPGSKVFLRVLKSLLTEKTAFTSLLQHMYRDITDSVPTIMESSSLEEFIEKSSWKLKIRNETNDVFGGRFGMQFGVGQTKDGKTLVGRIWSTADKTLLMNDIAKEHCEEIFASIKELSVEKESQGIGRE